jgi:hypothetical protein
MARALAPPSRKISASTVGLPRESRTCRPRTSAILVNGMSASFIVWIDRKHRCSLETLLPSLHAKTNYIGPAAPQSVSRNHTSWLNFAELDETARSRTIAKHSISQLSLVRLRGLVG